VGHEKSPFAAIASMMTLNLGGPDIQPRHRRSDGRQLCGWPPDHAPPRSPPHPATVLPRPLNAVIFMSMTQTSSITDYGRSVFDGYAINIAGF
jgi:hypothetical protein